MILDDEMRAKAIEGANERLEELAKLLETIHASAGDMYEAMEMSGLGQEKEVEAMSAKIFDAIKRENTINNRPSQLQVDLTATLMVSAAMTEHLAEQLEAMRDAWENPPSDSVSVIPFKL